jgi:hypothetical protein
MKAAEILCPEKQQLFKNISLSANTMAAGNVQCQLKEKSKNCVAVAIVESTDVKILHSLLFLFEVLMRSLN